MRIEASVQLRPYSKRSTISPKKIRCRWSLEDGRLPYFRSIRLDSRVTIVQATVWSDDDCLLSLPELTHLIGTRLDYFVLHSSSYEIFHPWALMRLESFLFIPSAMFSFLFIQCVPCYRTKNDKEKHLLTLECETNWTNEQTHRVYSIFNNQHTLPHENLGVNSNYTLLKKLLDKQRNVYGEHKVFTKYENIFDWVLMYCCDFIAFNNFGGLHYAQYSRCLTIFRNSFWLLCLFIFAVALGWNSERDNRVVSQTKFIHKSCQVQLPNMQLLKNVEPFPTWIVPHHSNEIQLKSQYLTRLLLQTRYN